MVNPEQTLEQLIEAVLQELVRMNYNRYKINSPYKRNFLMFNDYAKAQPEAPYFTKELGDRFLEEMYEYSPDDTKACYPRTIQDVIRCVKMLEEYSVSGKFSPQYHKKVIAVNINPLYRGILQLFNKHLANRELSQGTIYSLNQKAEFFLDFLTKAELAGISSITSAIVSDYICSLAAYSKNSKKEYLYMLRTFLRFLFETGVHNDDLSKKIPVLFRRRRERIPKTWTISEVQKLLSSVDRDTAIGKRDYAVLTLVAMLGLRNSEVSNLKFENIIWESGRIEINQAKNLNSLSLPLANDVGWAVIDYLQNGRPNVKSPYVFVCHKAPFTKIKFNNSIFYKYRRLASLEISGDSTHSLHSLRHTLAGRLLAVNTPLPIISEILGHTSVETTKAYLKIDIEKLRSCALDPEGVFANA